MELPKKFRVGLPEIFISVRFTRGVQRGTVRSLIL